MVSRFSDTWIHVDSNIDDIYIYINISHPWLESLAGNFHDQRCERNQGDSLRDMTVIGDHDIFVGMETKHV